MRRSDVVPGGVLRITATLAQAAGMFGYVRLRRTDDLARFSPPSDFPIVASIFGF
jgi:hypothetical protein